MQKGKRVSQKSKKDYSLNVASKSYSVLKIVAVWIPPSNWRRSHTQYSVLMLVMIWVTEARSTFFIWVTFYDDTPDDFPTHSNHIESPLQK